MIMQGLSLRSWATILLVALVVVVEGWVATARQRIGVYALQLVNIQAERDSTRRVDGINARAVRVLGDSLRLMERLMVQRTQRQDERDHSLGRGRLARYAMTVQADSLAAIAQGVSVGRQADTSSSVRSASFRIHQPPYGCNRRRNAAAAGYGHDVHRVALDPLHVEARVSCASADGIRVASVSATGPA